MRPEIASSNQSSKLNTSEPTTQYQVWLIGGTRDSAELASELSAQRIPYVVTVTTESARSLYPRRTHVQVGKLGLGDMAAFIQAQQIGCVLDASHPFACDVSQQAMSIAQSILSTAYLRYERPVIAPVTPTDAASDTAASDIAVSSPSTTVLASIEALLASDKLRNQRVLFTLGYRQLSRFSHLHATAKLFARILPSTEAILGAQAAGFESSNLVAMRPPVSLPLEKALWQQWGISKVVAKASGVLGGEAIKRQAAAELSVELLLIQRPPVTYPHLTHSLSEAVSTCAKYLRQAHKLGQ